MRMPIIWLLPLRWQETAPDVAERVVRTITRRITDWEQLAANLALVGAKLAVSDPETVRKAIENNSLVPA